MVDQVARGDAQVLPIPLWQSHKRVHADKITKVETGKDFSMVWQLAGGARIKVANLLARRVPDSLPALGGYYVLYDDGYESWSPAQAFEEGYTRV